MKNVTIATIATLAVAFIGGMYAKKYFVKPKTTALPDTTAENTETKPAEDPEKVEEEPPQIQLRATGRTWKTRSVWQAQPAYSWRDDCKRYGGTPVGASNSGNCQLQSGQVVYM